MSKAGKERLKQRELNNIQKMIWKIDEFIKNYGNVRIDGKGGDK